MDKWYKKLLCWGFCGNYWEWFHLLAGGSIAKIADIWLSGLLSVIIVFVIAVIWERIEFKVECKGDWEIVKKIYGSVERYWYDTAGDIILAGLCAILVIL